MVGVAIAIAVAGKALQDTWFETTVDTCKVFFNTVTR